MFKTEPKPEQPAFCPSKCLYSVSMKPGTLKLTFKRTSGPVLGVKTSFKPATKAPRAPRKHHSKPAICPSNQKPSKNTTKPYDSTDVSEPFESSKLPETVFNPSEAFSRPELFSKQNQSQFQIPKIKAEPSSSSSDTSPPNDKENLKKPPKLTIIPSLHSKQLSKQKVSLALQETQKNTSKKNPCNVTDLMYSISGPLDTTARTSCYDKAPKLHQPGPVTKKIKIEEPEIVEKILKPNHKSMYDLPNGRVEIQHTQKQLNPQSAAQPSIPIEFKIEKDLDLSEDDSDSSDSSSGSSSGSSASSSSDSSSSESDSD